MVTGASTADLSVVLVDARDGVVEPEPPPRVHRVAAAGSRTSSWPSTRWTSSTGTRTSSSASARTSATSAARARRQGAHLHPDLGAEGRQRRRPLGRTWPGTAARRCCTTSSTAQVAAGLQRAARLPGPVGDPRDRRAHDYRGYAGQVAGGILRPGDDVVVLPAGAHARIAASTAVDGPLGRRARAAVGHRAARGRARRRARRPDLRAPTTRRARAATLDATSAGWARRRAAPGGALLLKHTTRSARAPCWRRSTTRSTSTTLAPATRGRTRSALNEIGRVTLRVRRRAARSTPTRATARRARSS